MSPHKPARLSLWICLVLAAATLAVYWPVLHHDFIIYDDGQYIRLNPHVVGGLSWGGVKWAFTSTYASNWHPLTWLSHMLDAQLYGLKPGGHHLTNLLLHIANSLLLFLALKRLTGTFWRSALVAALFALHPVHVESVAWAAERKDVLSAFFFMLTLLAYAKYAKLGDGSQESGADLKPENEGRKSEVRSQRPGQRPKAKVWYGLTLGFFALGLMSKPMLVTLPFVLLLLDYWPLGRFRSSEVRGQRSDVSTDHPPTSPSIHKSTNSSFRRSSAFVPLLLEKLPFFALSAASCLITFLAQKGGGSMASLDQVAFEQRAGNALIACFAYLEKMVWPDRLALLYLAPKQWPLWLLALAAVVLAAITLAAWALRRTQPYFGVGWLWYLGMLVPVIGLVQVGNQFMADRYTYLPLIGCFIVLAWGAGALAQRFRLANRIPAALAVVVLGAAAVQARRQVDHWQDSETILTHCLQATGRNSIAHNNLGAALAEQNRFPEAKAHFLAALEIRPGDADIMHNLGVLLVEQGDFDEGLAYLRRGASIKPELVAAYSKLGFILDSQGKVAQAVTCYREYLQTHPDGIEVCNNLAWILATHPDPSLRNGSEAVRLAEHACALTGYKQTPLIGTLAAAYAEAGRFPEAVAAAEKATALAAAAGQQALADRNRQLLELYRAGKPCRETNETVK